MAELALAKLAQTELVWIELAQTKQLPQAVIAGSYTVAGQVAEVCISGGCIDGARADKGCADKGQASRAIN